MHLVAIAWLYVVVMMAAAEALSSRGSWLGALFTLLLYGVLPLSIVLYIGGWPGRRRLRQRAQAQEETAARAAATEAEGAAAHGGSALSHRPATESGATVSGLTPSAPMAATPDGTDARGRER